MRFLVVFGGVLSLVVGASAAAAVSLGPSSEMGQSGQSLHMAAQTLLQVKDGAFDQLAGHVRSLSMPVAQWIGKAARAVYLPFTQPYSRIGPVTLAAAAALAFLVYCLHEAPRPRLRIRGFIAYLLPRNVYSHPSAITDAKIYIFSKVFKPAKLILLGVGVGAGVPKFASLLTDVFGDRGHIFLSGPVTHAFLALALFLAFDLSTYITHRLSHEIPVLWAFHRVHHSAEVLTPLTLHRKHPVYDALGTVLDISMIVPLQGAIIYLWGAEPNHLALGSVTVIFGVFAWAGSALRHSHIWLSFGPIGDRLIVSPASHQIHHSRAAEHWNRNYGEVLAIWDVVFGTAYVPKKRETISFGLAGEEQPHPGLVRAMVEPFAFAWRSLFPARGASADGRAA